MRTVMNFLLACALLSAADPSRTEILQQRRERYPMVVQMQELAQAIPPELGAYAELRMAESGRLNDKAYRQELVEDSFNKASHSLKAVSQRAIASTGLEGTQAGIGAQVARLGLDGLSLQSRAVSDLASIDPKRARMFFEMIVLPAPVKLSCADALVEDYSAYYGAAERVLKGLKGDESIRFTNDLLSRIQSASQLTGATRLLNSQSAAAFAAALQRVDGDDRSFTASLADLKAAMNRAAPGNAVLVTAYRQYLVRHLHATRCAESLSLDWNVEIARQSVAEFNQYAGDSPIREDEATARGKGESAKLEQILDPGFANAQKTRYLTLMFGAGNRGLSAQEKSESEWQHSFREALSEISSMKPAQGQSEASFFYSKGGALHALLLAAPPGAEREAVLGTYLEFLQNSTFQKENPAEWFASVDSLLSMGRSLDPEEGVKVLQMLQGSGNAALRLFAMLEQNTSARPDWAR